MKFNKKNSPVLKGILMSLVCVAILATGFGGMRLMAETKKAPSIKPTIKKGMSVTSISVLKQAVAVTAVGYGQAEPVREDVISPRVYGIVMEKNPNLDPGGRVEKDEILFKIDATDYEITAEKASIQVELRNNQIEQLKVSFKKDKGRLDAIQQNTRLARQEFLRLKQLYKNSRVGTLSARDSAEQTYNSLLDTEKNLKKSLDLYPLQIAEAQANLADEKANLKATRLDVNRCVIVAPFSGRIKESSVETGAHVSTGFSALILCDDRILEIKVPLSDREAFEVLNLRGDSKSPGRLDVKNLTCRVEIVTGHKNSSIKGTVHRVIKYDSDSRTLTLAARVYQEDMAGAALPLMDGMFCKIIFTGPVIEDLVKIPANALNSNQTVYLDRAHQLKTLDVTQVMADGDHVYVTGGFLNGDRIITTQLNNPFENINLAYTKDEESNDLPLAAQKALPLYKGDIK